MDACGQKSKLVLINLFFLSLKFLVKSEQWRNKVFPVFA